MNSIPQPGRSTFSGNFHGIVEVSQMAKDACIKEAIDINLSKLDLIDPCCAIATLAAKNWARVDQSLINELFPDRAMFVDEFILAGMRYKEGAPLPILENAIMTLPALVPYYGGDILEQIGKLLNIFGRFTQSQPTGWKIDAWRNILCGLGQTIAKEARAIEADPQHDRTLIDQALHQVLVHYENLWS